MPETARPSMPVDNRRLVPRVRRAVVDRLRYVHPAEPDWVGTTRAMGLGFVLPWTALYLGLAAPAMGWWPW